ncbi:MAG: glycosyltransferase, partial [Gemmatimonadetes bacterium]|nr:glycosyltransferase [Gemmatimonadota bacterium]
ACGVPVVGTRVGGMPEVVSDERLGFLGDVGDVDSMTRAAVELLRDSRRWREASEAGRALAVERFSNEKIVPVYERLYAEVVGQAREAR